MKSVTRGPKGRAQGSPRDAVAYITDGHDGRRDPAYSDPELAYIARMGGGWKAEIEGGRIPLVGFGVAAGAASEKEMLTCFEDACRPYGGYWCKQGTAGYRSITFTIPKEVSLYSEGRREEAKAAMYAAAGRALEAIYGDKHYAAVGAIHTRNEAGEIHYHLHVLVGKFAHEKATEKVVSLSSRHGGSTSAQLRLLKQSWKESIDREFKERLDLTIEQRARNSAPALVLPDGTRLEPLNREGRRVLEKEIAPWYAAPAGGGQVAVPRQLRLNAMDDRIFELASGKKGKGGWAAQAFVELFPDQARFVGRHEKRVETLRQVGYLTPDGRPTPEFRLHFAIKHGVNTRELQRLRIDIANRAVRGEKRAAARQPASAPAHKPPDIWQVLDRHESLRKRVERLGFSRDDLRRIQAEADKQKPTPERLAAIRADVERQVALAPPRNLPETRGIIRAFVGVQAMRLHRIYLLTESIATLGLRYRHNRDLAEQIKKSAERDLFYAKEKRLAQLGRGLRPIFWAVRVALPSKARRIEKAIERCGRLAQSQEVRRLYREEITRAYKEWRARFIDRPRADLERQAQALARPEQEAGRRQVEKLAKQIELRDLDQAVRLLKLGRPVLEKLRPAEAAHLRKWVGKEEVLVKDVVAASKGEPHIVPKAEYEATLKAGRLAHLLEVERSAKAPEVPQSMAQHAASVGRINARLAAFGIASPFTSKPLKSVPPVSVGKAIAVFEKAGAMGDGPEWLLAAGAMRQAAATVNQLLDRERDVERQLIDRLLAGRNRP